MAKGTKRKAIVTLAAGARYVHMFDQLCRRQWSEYAERFGFDLIVIKDLPDSSERARERSPAWQKLLICSQDWSKNYEQIVWIDADILINVENAPDVCEGAPAEKISAVEAWSIPSRNIHDIALARLYKNWAAQGIKFIDNLSPQRYYQNRGIDAASEIDCVVQTGVFVCSPAHHRQFFEHVYHSYEDNRGPEGNYEMPAMSYEIIKNNLHHWISPEYNYCVSSLTAAFYPFIFHGGRAVGIIDRVANKLRKGERFRHQLKRNELVALSNIYELGFFIHFAGCSSLMGPLHRYLGEHKLI